jgi:transglutaminase-like putative cysteine protease
MRIKKSNIFLIVLVLTTIVFSGCIELFQEIPTTYNPYPTKINYTLNYGYKIKITGTGNYKINYRCDIPEVLKGQQTYTPLYSFDYNITTRVNNSFLNWNISGRNQDTYKLGITTSITSESFLIPDLNGKNALSIKEINRKYPDIVKKYLNDQMVENITYIDSNHPAIKTISSNIVVQAKTNNSFIIAKSLFIWLKENINYKLHDGQGDVQPTAITLQKKTGDCDDLSFLYISLCRAVGIPARLIRGYLLQGNENSGITATAHAWVEIFVGGLIGNNGWLPVECACCASTIEIDINQNFGVEDAFHIRLFTDDGSNKSLDISLSGIYVQYYENQQIDLQSFSNVSNYQEITSQKLVVTKENIRYYE